MRKKIVFTNALVSIQLAITFAIATLLINMIFNFYNENKRYSEIISENKTLIFKQTVEDSNKDINKILLGIFNRVGDGLIKCKLLFEEGGTNFKELEDKYEEMQDNEISLNKYRNDDGDYANNLKTTRLSSEFYNRYPIKIYQGRGFSIDEINGIFQNNEIPIIVGYDLKDYVKLGQTLNIKLNKNQQVINDKVITNMEDINQINETDYFTYKVVGIADRNMMVRLGNDIPYSVSFASDRIYMPYKSYHFKVTENGIIKAEANVNENEKNLQNVILECSSEEDTKILMNTLNEELKKEGVTGKFKSVEENNSFKEAFTDCFKNIGMLGVIVFVFSIIGTMVVNIFTIRLKYKEYGIRLSQGATHKDIALSIIIKNSLLVSISALVGFSITYFLTLIIDDAMTKTLFSINFSSGIWLVSLLVIIIIITSILPIISLYKNSVVKLIREG